MLSRTCPSYTKTFDRYKAATNPESKLKILVGFVQIWTIMPSLYEVEMPDEIYEWFSSFTKIFALDIDDVYPSACFGSMQIFPPQLPPVHLRRPWPIPPPSPA